MKDDYYSFVFKGLLTEQALEKAGNIKNKNYKIESEIEISEKIGISILDEERIALARKMAIVYTAICAFENALRRFIERKLLEEVGENWWETSIQEPIKEKVAARKENESTTRWHSARGDSLINYTDLGDLALIMHKKENWPFFEPHLTLIDWSKNIIQTLEKSRNVIMHGGILEMRDIERIGMHIRDWVQQTGVN